MPRAGGVGELWACAGLVVVVHSQWVKQGQDIARGCFEVMSFKRVLRVSLKVFSGFVKWDVIVFSQVHFVLIRVVIGVAREVAEDVRSFER